MNLIPLAIQYPYEFNRGFFIRITSFRLYVQLLYVQLSLHYFAKNCTISEKDILFRLVLNCAKFCIFSVFSLASGKNLFPLFHQ